MVLDHDDNDPQQDFYEDQGIGEDIERDFNRPTMRRKNRRGPGLSLDASNREPRRLEEGYGYRKMSKGPYSGVGPYNYRRGDERIYEDVIRRLTDHGSIDARNISIFVDSGEVTLRGTVSDRLIKRLAEDVAASVAGVRDVHNELRLVNKFHQPDDTIESSADQEGYGHGGGSERHREHGEPRGKEGGSG